MVIQPFIENAIIHAFSNKSSEKLIIIKFKKEGDYLIIEIIDNGLGRTFLEESKKANESHKNLNSATKNIEERLALLEKLTKKKHNITIVDLFDDKQNSAGTKVIITLPTLDNYE